MPSRARGNGSPRDCAPGLRCKLGERGGGLVGSAQGLQVYAELLAFLVQMAAF
jgi:hypothetical protein